MTDTQTHTHTHRHTHILTHRRGSPWVNIFSPEMTEYKNKGTLIILSLYKIIVKYSVNNGEQKCLREKNKKQVASDHTCIKRHKV